MSLEPDPASLSRRDDIAIVGVSLLAKLLVLVYGLAVVALLGGRIGPEPDGVAAQAPAILAPWVRWDAPHYLDIAVFGYRAFDTTGVGPGGYQSISPGDLPDLIVFFPLFPWLIAATMRIVSDPSTAAFLVSGVALVFVGPLLYRVVAAEEGRLVGRRSVWFLLLFPTAYFLYIGYSESLFLALVLGTLLSARSERWWLAGILGALATLARVNGLLLIPTLMVEAFLQWRATRRLDPGWLAIAIVPLGFVAYLGVNQSVYGDPVAFLEIQRTHWQKVLSPPWVGIGNLLASDLPRAWIPELLFIGLGLVGTVAAALRFRATWTVWMATNILLFTSTSVVLSVPRYSIVLFPLFAWFALLSRSRFAGLAIGAISAGGLLYLAGRFALGLWAF